MAAARRRAAAEALTRRCLVRNLRRNDGDDAAHTLGTRKDATLAEAAAFLSRLGYRVTHMPAMMMLRAIMTPPSLALAAARY